MNRSKWLFVFAIVMTVIVLWFVNSYHKWGATWWGLPVIGFAAFAALFTWFITGKVPWFADADYRAGTFMRLAPALGLAGCLFLGIHFTELKPEMAWTTDQGGQPTYAYNYARTPAGHYYYSNWYGYGSSVSEEPRSSSSHSHSSGSHSKNEGEAIVILFIIALIVLLAVGSGFIAHFWVLACAILLTLMWRVAVRELHYEEPGRKRYRY